MASELPKLDETGTRGLIALYRSIEKASPERGALEVADVAAASAVDDVLVVIYHRGKALVQRTGVHGRKLSVKDLRLRLMGAEAALGDLATRAAEPSAQLPASEARRLDQIGFVDSPSEVPGAFERSLIDFSILRRDSVSLDEAATALGVSTSRLRQRLAPSVRTIFGFKEGRNWRLPRFQFESRRRLLPGIAVVLPRIRIDAHPLAVYRWFITPHQDLVMGDDEVRVSPRDWLASGGDANAAAELATEI